MRHEHTIVVPGYHIVIQPDPVMQNEKELSCSWVNFRLYRIVRVKNGAPLFGNAAQQDVASVAEAEPTVSGFTKAGGCVQWPQSFHLDLPEAEPADESDLEKLDWYLHAVRTAIHEARKEIHADERP